MIVTENSKTIVVSRDQVAAARALIELHGGTDKVEPWVAKIAAAIPRSRAEHDLTPRAS